MQRYVFSSFQFWYILIYFADWSPVKVYPKVLRLVSRINAKILVGNGLQENEDWIDISASVSNNGHRNALFGRH